MEKVKDTIYRQAAIELIHSLYPSAPIMRINRKHWEKKYEPYIEAEKALEQLPSAQPERKTGKWIYITDGHYEYFKCDQCEKHSGEPTPFCRYCGADMREVQDESN